MSGSVSDTDKDASAANNEGIFIQTGYHIRLPIPAVASLCSFSTQFLPFPLMTADAESCQSATAPLADIGAGGANEAYDRE